MEIVNGILVAGVGEMREQQIASQNENMTPEDYERAGLPVPVQPDPRTLFTSALAGHILKEFYHNRDARRNSLTEEEMLDSLRAYNGEYNPEDLARINQTGGSSLFINLTGVKARAAASWIRDILLPAKEKAWGVEPTPLVELPQEMLAQIDRALHEQFKDYLKFIPEDQQKQIAQQEQQKKQQQGAPQPQAAVNMQQEEFQPQQQGNPNNASTAQPAEAAAKAAKTLKEFNQARRDIQDMVLNEINKIAQHEMMKQELMIEDQLAEGGWNDALSDFIDDFVVFPTAFLKGPIISKDDTLHYVNGQAVPSQNYVYKNKRVSPFDMYPSPNATGIDDGTNIIEHCRFTRRELSDLRNLPGYRTDAIDRVLEEYEGTTNWLDTGIEGDKALGEKRGDEWQANRDIIHGLHFHGSVPAGVLKEWGIEDSFVYSLQDTEEMEVEAIIAGDYAIKAKINRDPLRRRPYYKASYQKRPGSFWGRSLPSQMSDIQRMCNASARALSNNMGLASGPQIELYVDRLADNGDITNIQPFKIWQLTSDPTGAGGRAIQFTQPTSNAQELLAVFKEFELRADDATGIPRYSYGNERVGGAAQTASGLSMLLESASKAIKDCIRNIDKEVIVPRVEYQFYWNVVSDPENRYSGDPKVIGRGSSALTTKGSEQMRRNEFLQITANPIDQQIMGMDGRAEILRAIAEDLNLSENVIPSRLELKAQQQEQAKKAAEQQQQQLQLEDKKINVGLQATKEQISGQERMHQQTQQFKLAELQAKQQGKAVDTQVTMAKLEAGREAAVQKSTQQLAQTQAQEEGKDQRFNTEVALKLKRGEGI